MSMRRKSECKLSSKAPGFHGTLGLVLLDRLSTNSVNREYMAAAAASTELYWKHIDFGWSPGL
jgi:hypothetical protein